jgi:hypothetical protein
MIIQTIIIVKLLFKSYDRNQTLKVDGEGNVCVQAGGMINVVAGKSSPHRCIHCGSPQ